MELHIKRTLQPLIRGRKILFGIGNKGLTRSIPNTDENVQLIKYLNGELTRNKLNLSDDQLNLKVDELIKIGVITTNKYESDPKYSRNLNFFEWMDMTDNIDPSIYQKRLFHSYVAVFGVGGIGSAVAECLVRAGVHKIKLIDFDTVEESNLTRQTAYIEKDVGKEKVEVCAKYLKQINPSVEVKTSHCKITNTQDIRKNLTRDIDLIVDCMDKPAELDNWFDEISNLMNIPVIFSSYASTAANVYVKIPGVTQDYSKFLGKEQITQDCIIDNTFPMAAISSVTVMAAGMSSFNAIMLLTRLRVPTEAIQIDFDGWTVLKLDVSI